MKRLILTGTGTIAGLAALLSVKAHSPISAATTLPSAGTTSGSPGAAHSGAAHKHAASSSTKPVGPAVKTYTGQAITTRYGVVQVKVTVADGTITDVAFVQLTAFDGHSQEINSYAAPQLLQETLQSQSAQVDTVSGATYTSAGYMQSVQSALDQTSLR